MTGKKKILILGKLPPPYIGPAVATQIILNSSFKEKYNLLFLNTKINYNIKQFGKINFIKPFRNLLLYFKMLFLLLSNFPNIVLIPISQTTLGFVKDSIYILIAYLFGRKTVLHLRGSGFLNWYRSSSFFTKAYTRFVLKKCKGIIVLGESLKYLFIDFFPNEKIFAVSNGGNFDFLKKTNNSSEIHLLYFANFLPSKGFRNVLLAMDFLKKKGIHNLILNAIGAWDNKKYEMECKLIAEQNKLPVIFHSPQFGEKKWESFANADIFIFTPNEPEGHPWVIVEAMAAGLPIISTNQGIIAEAVKDNLNGFIVNTKSPNEIADRIEKLLNDEPLRKEMGKKSRERYLQYYTEEKMVEALSNVFETVMKQ